MLTTANALVSSLASYCAGHVLEEKLLLAPRSRIGWQWVDATVLTGVPVANLRVRTVYSLARDILGGQASKLTLLPHAAGPLLIERAWRSLPPSGYLSSLEPSFGLFERAYDTVRALRVAGLEPGDLREPAFEVAMKGAELRVLLDAYVRELHDAGFADHADLLKAARAALPAGFPDRYTVLVPADLTERLGRLERELIEAVPAQRLHLLDVDGPGPLGSPSQDLELLRCLAEPTSAPRAAGDDSVRFFHAMGEEVEVREAVRRAFADGPLDATEILYSAADPYLPLLIESFWRMQPDGANELPATFDEGIPCLYARPGRALRAWARWVREGHPQRTVTAMLREGLIRLDGETSPHAAGRAFAEAPILRGFERYRPRMEKFRQSLQLRTFEGNDEEVDEERARYVPSWRPADWAAAEAAVHRLLQTTPLAGAGTEQVLECARRFLAEACACRSELDNYARERMEADIRGLQETLCALGSTVTLFDAWAWLDALPGSSRIKGEGPRPGRVHCAPLSSGGHSGRTNTIILGLDESRLPGRPHQDPLLLDAEKEALSEHLCTAAQGVRRRLAEFQRLVARLRGRVTLAFSSMSLQDGREQFPSSVFLEAYRLVRGPREAEMREVMDALGPRVGFAPDEEARCCNITEWWLWRCCTAADPTDATEALCETYPNLAAGMQARRARESLDFTPYDGRLPDPPRELDPLAAEGPAVSAGALETLAECPLRYFFRRVLRAKPPAAEPDPDEWLDALQFGSLMHEVFATFVRERIGQPPGPLEEARDRLREILEERIAYERDEWPPPSEAAVAEQRRRMETLCEAFLQEEMERESEPVYVEVCVGFRSDGPATDVDRPEPVGVPMEGRALRLVGRIDRIDRTSDGYVLVDYKTGSDSQYRDMKRYSQGRILQPLVYLHLAEGVLGQRPLSFAYLFPSGRGEDVRYVWPAEELLPYRNQLTELCRLAASGAFPATNYDEDCKYCDYQRVCGDYEAVAERSAGKLANPENDVLAPLRRLRGVNESTS